MNKIDFAYFMEEYLQEAVNWRNMVSPQQRIEKAYDKASLTRSPAGAKARRKLVDMHISAEDKRIRRAEAGKGWTVKPEDYSQY